MAATPQPIKIAILAMGGEGGGVLADWIVSLAEHNGYLAQATSVPGVAQRTGATIYYVELYPSGQAENDGGMPVLALMPLPGDVDVVLASELMEAGRAVQRGLVTVDRTTLIASTHRVYSITEKSAMGDGRIDDAQLLKHAGEAARRFVRFDMAATAEAQGSQLSAVLFGALAGANVLPFKRMDFATTIVRGRVGVDASLRAFGAAFMRAESGAGEASTEPVAPPSSIALSSLSPPRPTERDPRLGALLERVRRAFPADAQAMLIEGVRRTIDYQDLAYADVFLDRMASICSLPAGEPADSIKLINETARHLALWMSYEDSIRVAELKTRASRFDRVRGEVRVQGNQLLAIHEYMHPGLQEICETLPASLGRWLLASSWPRRLVERVSRGGRVVTTTSLRGFLMLYAVAGLKRWRRATLRFAQENALIEQWLGLIQSAAAVNPDLAIEVALCQRLVKGYSDTHERGLRNYKTLIAVVGRAGLMLPPATLRELRDAALADEGGHALRAALGRYALG